MKLHVGPEENDEQEKSTDVHRREPVSDGFRPRRCQVNDRRQIVAVLQFGLVGHDPLAEPVGLCLGGGHFEQLIVSHDGLNRVDLHVENRVVVLFHQFPVGGFLLGGFGQSFIVLRLVGCFFFIVVLFVLGFLFFLLLVLCRFFALAQKPSLFSPEDEFAFFGLRVFQPPNLAIG